MEKTVRTAGVSDAETIYAELIIPEDLESPESRQEVGVEERINDDGEIEINLAMLWVGGNGSAEYRAYVQKVIEELGDRIVERCGSS